MNILKKVLLFLKKTFRAIFSLKTLFVILITFVLLEVTLNVWLTHFANKESVMNFATMEYTMLRNPPRFVAHPYLNYALSPDFTKGDTNHTAQGFRGPDFETKKPKGVFRIVAIGGSTTYTEYVDNDRETYPARLEAELKQLGYSHVEVINGGAPGYASWETLINLQFRVLDLDPDMIIIYQNVNDVHSRIVDPNLYKGDNTAYRRSWSLPETPWYESITTVRVLLRLQGHSYNINGIKWLTVRDNPYRQKHVSQRSRQKMLKENPPRYYLRNIRNMISIAQANNVDVMLATWAYYGNKWAEKNDTSDYIRKKYYQNAVNQQNRILRSLGRQHHVPVYDFAREMPTHTCPGCWRDGRHVNRKGAAVKAELFANFIHKSGLIKSR